AMMFYLSQWFPARERARAVGAVSSATVISLVIGGPLSGALLEMPPWLGLASWKWLFIIEGFPAVIAGIIVFFVLPDRPAEAGWLTDNERRELASVIEQDRVRETGRSLSGAWEAILDWRVWFLFLFYVLIAVSFYGTVLWLPQIIQSLHDLST